MILKCLKLYLPLILKHEWLNRQSTQVMFPKTAKIELITAGLPCVTVPLKTLANTMSIGVYLVGSKEADDNHLVLPTGYMVISAKNIWPIYFMRNGKFHG